MPLELIAGISKKLGLPGYSSVGAICHMELELDSRLIQEAPEAFLAQVREVYALCAESVDEELARQQALRNPAESAAETPADEFAAANRDGSAHGNGQAQGNPMATAILTVFAPHLAAPTAGRVPGCRPARWNMPRALQAGSAWMRSNSIGFVDNGMKGPLKSLPAARRVG